MILSVWPLRWAATVEHGPQRKVYVVTGKPESKDRFSVAFVLLRTNFQGHSHLRTSCDPGLLNTHNGSLSTTNLQLGVLDIAE